jgi:hypothetical protein
VQRTVTQLTCGINVCSACNQRVELFGKASHRRDVDWEVSAISPLIHVLEHELAELRQVLFHISFQYICRSHFHNQQYRAKPRPCGASQMKIAEDWDLGLGTVTPGGVWNLHARCIALEQRLDMAEAARLFATLNVAMTDAFAAAWPPNSSGGPNGRSP